MTRPTFTGSRVHVAFGTQAQEAFLEGHVLAFEHFGGVPGRVRYDKLKPAVVRVLEGRVRAVHRSPVALRFDSVFCRPCVEGAHEQGASRASRTLPSPPSVPIPKVDSLAALNELIAAGDVVDDGRVITDGRSRSRRRSPPKHRT